MPTWDSCSDDGGAERIASVDAAPGPEAALRGAGCDVTVTRGMSDVQKEGVCSVLPRTPWPGDRS